MQNNSTHDGIKTCRHFPECGGCQNREQTLQSQGLLKRQQLFALLQKYSPRLNVHQQMIEIHDLSPSGVLRDRVDYVFQNGQLGLFRRTTDFQTKSLIDIPDCQILSPGLKKNVQAFRDLVINNQDILNIWNQIFKNPVSLRFRYHPNAARPLLWIDAANLEIRDFLKTEQLIDLLTDKFILEIGQKLKQVKKINQVWKLVDHANENFAYHPIFQTRYRQKKIDLLGSIGHFTQPSLFANEWITEKIEHFAEKIQANSCVEFGSGIGNLSIPMAGYTKSVIACDWDQSALSALQATIQSQKISNVQIIHGDFQQEKKLHSVASIIPETIDILLLNPARSGVKNFIRLAEQKNRYLVYMSCFPETMAQDLSVIQDMYNIQEMHIIEQFPWTDHFEVLTFLERK